MDCKLPTPFSLCKPNETIYLMRVELIWFGTNSSTTMMLLCKNTHTATKWYGLLTIQRSSQCYSCKNKNIHMATKWAMQGLGSAYVYQLTSKLHLQLLGQAKWHHQTLFGSSWCSILQVSAHVGRVTTKQNKWGSHSFSCWKLSPSVMSVSWLIFGQGTLVRS